MDYHDANAEHLSNSTLRRFAMTETIAIVCFWFLGGLIGNAWMTRLIVGFPSRKAVDVLAISWGLIVAGCARLIIVSLDLGLVATVITYFVGIVISGTTARKLNSPTSSALHEMKLILDYTYYKKEVLASIPRITYVVASAILFFLWA